MPREKLRYCQSLMAARRGKTLLMPAHCHACPDGTTILGLTEIPAKLASGELYIRFGKLATIEAARQMIAERPRLEPRSIQATLVTPLAQAVLPPDVIAVIAQPEQMMWLCMAASFYTGQALRVQGQRLQRPVRRDHPLPLHQRQDQYLSGLLRLPGQLGYRRRPDVHGHPGGRNARPDAKAWKPWAKRPSRIRGRRSTFRR